MAYYPNRPGYVRGSKTSEAAADRWSDKRLRGIRGGIYSLIYDSELVGMTCEQCEIELRLKHQSCSARIRELVLFGLIVIKEIDGEEVTRPGTSGSPQRVYIATPHWVKTLPADRQPRLL